MPPLAGVRISLGGATITALGTSDAGGRLTGASDSADGALLNSYDLLDRLLAQTTTLGTVRYQYDALGRRTQLDAPNQASVFYGYDAASRLRTITQAPLTPVTVDYDALGRRTRLSLPNGVSTEHQYDAASRLTALIYRNATGQLGDLTYQYDPAGSRTRVGGAFSRTLVPTAVPGASYDGANRQLGFGSQLLTYDANGNLTSDGVNLYTWSARNQLLALTGAGVTATFSYDPLGRRQSRAVNGASTQFLYDGLNPIQEAGSTGIATLLTGVGIDEYLTRTDAAGARTLVTDALGSSVALTDAAGVAQTQYTYEPFGATAITGSTDANPFQYTGREHDGTGLYYYRARYYHPQLQRFIAQDPIGFTSGDLNLYAYVGNRPTNLRDPLGLAINWGKWVITNPILIANMQQLNQNIIDSGFADNQFSIRVTGGDRYIDPSGVIRSLTDNSVVENSAKNSPHLIEEGARGIDFTISGVGGDVLMNALRGTAFDRNSTYQERVRDRHWHTNLPDQPQFRHPSWPGDDPANNPVIGGR